MIRTRSRRENSVPGIDGAEVPGDPGGHASYPVDIEGSLSTSGWITAGSTWNFQAFYRDSRRAHGMEPTPTPSR